MTATVTLEVPVEHEALLRRTLALAEELHQLALSAPDGTVFDACETAVIGDGRELQQQMLQEAVARRIEAAEKKGRRSVSACAVAAKKTVAPKNGNW
jgi:hypothetical protein